MRAPGVYARGLALSAERLFQGAVGQVRLRAANGAARRLQIDRAYLRGRTCHCDRSGPLHLLHSEGVREGCDVVIDYGSNVAHPARKQLPLHVLRPAMRTLRAGDSVYVKADRLPSFVAQLLPELRVPIVLVTGDSDVSVVREQRALLDSPKIGHWFAQSCDLDQAHDKLTRLPIGFDNPVYTRIDKRIGFVVGMALGKTPLDLRARSNDIGDQPLLQRIARDGLPRMAARPALARCTFHQNQKLLRPDLRAIPERHAAFLALRENPACHFIAERLPQETYWRTHADFAFEVSPRGNGLDCFRTWECLFLGTIPIVKTSPLDRLYRDEQLPVVIVERYEDITQERLRAWQAELAPRFDRALVDKLTVDHWLARIARESLKLRDDTQGSDAVC